MKRAPVREPWTCHAKPAALGGKTCGHHNARGGWVAGVFRIVCCESCGATKAASDARVRKAAEAAR